MDEPQAYLNGRFLPASMALVSPVDTGFVQGAAVAEQLRTFAGKVFHLEDHLARLEQSLRIVDVDPRMDRRELAAVAGELVARNHARLEPGDDLGLSMFVTPGPYPAYSDPGEARPTVCLHTYPLPFRLWAEKYRTGQALVTTPIEQVPAECWPPALKCRSRMHYYLADRQAGRAEPGARALLLDRRGMVTEASTANLLIHTAAEGLVGPPPEIVLQGISLAVVRQLAGALGIPMVHRDLRPEEVARADEVILTSTPFCVLPATRLNGSPVGKGVPGPLFGRLLAAWSEEVGVDIAEQARRLASRGRAV
jgi:branched-subunit amino acid aminotransferase/4-amino-4-deoxychorismate lyase